MAEVFEWLPILEGVGDELPRLLADRWTIVVAKNANEVRMRAVRQIDVSEEEVGRLQIAVRFCGSVPTS